MWPVTAAPDDDYGYWLDWQYKYEWRPRDNTWWYWPFVVLSCHSCRTQRYPWDWCPATRGFPSCPGTHTHTTHRDTHQTYTPHIHTSHTDIHKAMNYLGIWIRQTQLHHFKHWKRKKSCPQHTHNLNRSGDNSWSKSSRCGERIFSSAIKNNQSLTENHMQQEHSESAQEWKTALYIKAVNSKRHTEWWITYVYGVWQPWFSYSKHCQKHSCPLNTHTRACAHTHTHMLKKQTM